MTSSTERSEQVQVIINNNKCSGPRFGIGTSLVGERNLLKKRKISIVNIPAADRLYEKVQATLRKVEIAMNKGWNTTDPTIIPLGDFDYVRRDLPVYKAAFEAIDVTVNKRFKGGVFNTEQLKDQDRYNGILCLSFNTDHCFPPESFKEIGLSRKVNRIKGLREIVWSKDKFCRTINSATRGIIDEDLLSFTFPCWIMPGGYKDLVKYSKDHDVNQWIAKPRALGAGKGIYVVNSWDELSLERKKMNLIQSYLTNPHLIQREAADGSLQRYKWDMRTYVLCTSISPLRAYVYNRGLVRIATSPYTKDCKNKTSCLTNTSINKKVEGAQLKDITWSFHKLKKYLNEHEQDESFDEIFLRIQKAIGMALISAESAFMKQYLKEGYMCQNCYQLLGVDIIFDSELEPKVVEINGEPSLKLTGNGKTHYDFTKKNMGKDLVAIVYNRESAIDKTQLSRRLMDWSKCVNAEENKKKSKNTFVGKDHMEYLLSTFRENIKLGGFKPIYPNPKLAEPYERYLKQLHEKEFKMSPVLSSGESRYDAHGNGRRLRLHKLVTALQDQKALIVGGYDDSEPGTLAPVKKRMVKKQVVNQVPVESNGDDDDDDDEGY
eukprot:CAMPEP_0204824038 /NCGR_PEP_ID=MMETSP1346-20131115/2098_1 /ASSEMBLY_ACC=CAM_ASM_000771 /TAXON_ID=215587 /ORGANISM="Aplanochytrium stocchinoi, Strain GSBS06" /LENGTH=604 /DNA_ID=CAMNT_0051950981 /DNA_START=252 /DNA_END=2066 /DNA_ORIENTATION=+